MAVNAEFDMMAGRHGAAVTVLARLNPRANDRYAILGKIIRDRSRERT